MGAQLWHYPGPWRDDPAESLFEVQVRRLREAFDYSALLQQHLVSARGAVQRSERDDPYDLLGFYRQEVARLEVLAALTPPSGPREEIDRLRVLYATSGEGIGSVLDVTHVSDAGGMHVTRRLTDSEVQKFCRSHRPTRNQAVAAAGKINVELGRGGSVCFPFYNADRSEPTGWYFVGNTID